MRLGSAVYVRDGGARRCATNLVAAQELIDQSASQRCLGAGALHSERYGNI